MSSGQYWQPANDPPPPRQHGQYSEYQAASPPSDADPYSYSPDHQQAPSRPGDFENSPPLQQVPVRKPTTPIVRKPVSAEAYQPLATPPPAAPPSAQNTPDYSYSPVPDASYNYQDAEPSISQQFLLPQEELSQKGPEVQPGARNPGLQTRYSTLALPGCQKLGHRYRPLKQFRKLAIPLLIRWVISLLLCGLVIALFVYFVEEKVLSKRKKRIFNGLFMGLSLAIGMNLGNALVTIADIMKWRILASGKWTARELDLILCISSYQKALKLLKMWRGNWLRVFYITTWVSLGIGAQVAVALLGLSYNHESEGAEYVKPGNVKISMLEHYTQTDLSKSLQVPLQYQEEYTAHLYGNMMAAYSTSVVIVNKTEEIGGESGLVSDASVVALGGRVEGGGHVADGWRLNYTDYTLLDGDTFSRGYITDRSVEINTKCNYSPITSGQNGTVSPFTVTYTDGTEEIVDWLTAGDEGTLYVTPVGLDCGPRCANVWVFQFVSTTADGSPPTEYGGFYECKVNVSNVTNAVLAEHHLSDEIAARAAGSIGLNGFTDTRVENEMQYQSNLYSVAAMWGARADPETEQMATMVGMFAAGSLSSMDRYNSRIQVTGEQIQVGVRLVVTWGYVSIVFGVIIVGHAIIAIFVCFRANQVFCKDGSPLSTARLLRPIVERLGASGCAATGKEIAASFLTKMTYGVRVSMNGQIHHLDIGEDLDILKRFPAGYYDGEYDTVVEEKEPLSWD